MKKILIVLAALVLLCTGANAQNKDSKNYVIGFYNLENLFDTYNDPAKNDEEFLPEGKNKWTEAKYQKKLQNMAKVIRSMKEENGAWHAILGVSEIENRLVLEDLVMEPQIAEANYQIIHYDGPDRRGVDVAMLYKPEVFKFLDSESIPFTFEGSSIDWIQSQEERDYFRTRDILMVHGLIDGEHFIFRTHVTFDGSDGSFGVGNSLAFCSLTDYTFAGFGKTDNGRSGSCAFGVRNNNCFASFHNCYAGVGSTKVNTDNFCHNIFLQLS